MLACGDVSLVPFVRRSLGVITAARDALKAGCAIVGDVPAVVAALDHNSRYISTVITIPIHLGRSLKVSKVAVQNAAARYNQEASLPH